MMNNKLFLLFFGLFPLFFGCKSSSPSNTKDEVRVENFIAALDELEDEDVNRSFRKALIKADRPIANVLSMHIENIKPSVIYEENELKITVCMLIEESIFNSRKYELKAFMMKNRKYKTFKSTDSGVISKIKGTKLSDCYISYHVSLKDFENIVFCNIKNGKEEDRLMTLSLVKDVKDSLIGQYNNAIKLGKTGGGVFTVSIQY